MEITRTSATAPANAVARSLEPRKVQEPTAAADNEKTETAEEPSSVKSFAYGVLDLDKPEAQTEDTESAYSAGKWLGAAAKVGGIISLLI